MRSKTSFDEASRPFRYPRATRVSAALLLMLAVVTYGAPVNAHHSEGQISLWMSQFGLENTSDGILMTALLVERDVGSPVSGFGVTISATSDTGEVVGPVELQESERGSYETILALSPGAWDIAITTHQGPSSLSALGSSHRTSIIVDVSGGAEIIGMDGGGSGLLWVIVAPVVGILVLGLFILWRKRLGRFEAAESTVVIGGSDRNEVE